MMAGKKGFTLVEVIIVTMLFSIVGLGVFSTFISGMKTWNRVKNMNLVRGNVFLTLERIAEEIRQSTDIPQINFEGEEDWVSFPARTNENIFEVVYLFDPDNKAVLRRQTHLTDIGEEKKSKDYTERRALAADRFSLQYLFFDEDQENYSWRDRWIKDDGPFGAVRFHIEKDGEAFSKTVFVPVAG